MEKEKTRYQVLHVPAAIRNRDSNKGSGKTVLKNYERITFHKELSNVRGKPVAGLRCPGHPLLDATIGLLLDTQLSLLNQATILIDEINPDSGPRLLFYIENSVQDAGITEHGQRRTISREVHFLDLEEDGRIIQAGYAPYLDYRDASEKEMERLLPEINSLPWIRQNMEDKIRSFVISSVAYDHLERVKKTGIT